MKITTKAHQPWHQLWQAHGHGVRAVQGWGSLALTLLLLGIGLLIVWIALRGSNRVKAATAVWTLFP